MRRHRRNPWTASRPADWSRMSKTQRRAWNRAHYTKVAGSTKPARSFEQRVAARSLKMAQDRARSNPYAHVVAAIKEELADYKLWARQAKKRGDKFTERLHLHSLRTAEVRLRRAMRQKTNPRRRIKVPRGMALGDIRRLRSHWNWYRKHGHKDRR